ncbi:MULTISPECIES: nickel ABC transporter ATP-binding protein NikE [Bradyrhizobium]|jgi:peptide/nickel transport system ATP-binding protein|uniref:ABC transporter ATP-binding protein n=1 Tax=Bradyrhizobium denitrificans TaxID=2734912 RepID=A0ABS5GET5_9BRAD|nr:MULTISPECIES: ABC transporter ATP-binding protein [Bradyrhizobium]MBR1139616.1 ABC transporter ATP-binding protein [Bradyrhizobium denitrificans]MDU1495381.1 ABC transporter ATP-binding protein [Bradyrhizobium sp.]MDU1545432.1 ABC transporter ATP-binding protein [Bradyrhizobium sp.]MDU1665030.1 ABC transporter ATP-binding protein [Bradyrhizobium sp.]MDU1690057.1 ABC transporter ATP-binding protein [Bradyrhizobium sp.]
MRAALTIDNYGLDYLTASGVVPVLRDVSLAIAPGEVLGLVGESGSGKSSLAWALMRHLPANAREISGSLQLGDIDLQSLTAKQLTAVRGRRIGMVFQDPSTALNPTLTIGRQITEALMRHRDLNARDAKALAIELLGHVELRDPAAVLRRYPHEISGGEKQRVIIATAFGCRPDVILFDEPTTALDVITGARIIDLFARLRAETGVAALYISHDLAMMTRVADRVAVIRHGRIVEQAKASEIFSRPQHDYTRSLIAAVPRPERRLVHDIPGTDVLLQARGIEVQYGRAGLFRAAPPPATKAVDIDIRAGEIVGVVGESGSGKSSIARALTGLARFSGAISFDGGTLRGAGDMGAGYRRDVQIVFQHPDSSLNPRHRIGEILSRPLKLYGGDTAAVPRLLEQVRLPASYATRWPHQLSGGEKQRVAIARAFAARPRLVICDEITAPLDVSVQAQIIDLLLALRAETGAAYLFITHDLNLIRQIAHRIVVMRHGQLVDSRAIDAFGTDDVHPYTRELMAASPAPVG